MNAGPVWKPWLRPTATRKRGARTASGKSSAKDVHSDRVGALSTTATTVAAVAATPTTTAYADACQGRRPARFDCRSDGAAIAGSPVCRTSSRYSPSRCYAGITDNRQHGRSAGTQRAPALARRPPRGPATAPASSSASRSAGTSTSTRRTGGPSTSTRRTGGLRTSTRLTSTRRTGGLRTSTRPTSTRRTGGLADVQLGRCPLGGRADCRRPLGRRPLGGGPDCRRPLGREAGCREGSGDAEHAHAQDDADALRRSLQFGASHGLDPFFVLREHQSSRDPSIVD